MKHKFFGVLTLSLLLSFSFSIANELPFGVSPKEISLSGTIDIVDGGSFGLSKGKLLNSYEWKEGNRVGVKVSSIEYTLNFWNVGKLGGTSGYLFWKKDFERATLRLEYIPESNGRLVTGKVDNSKIGLPDGWQLEDADSEPSINAVSCSLRFSGGPRGTFKGTCNNGATIEGRVAGTGSYVIFEKVTQPDDPEASELAITTLANKELMLSGQFSDWKFDASTLEDSGARFSSMTGEVETRHENDTEWNFAKLDTVLYVLDHVKTGEESQAIIGFADLSTFLLKDESEIVITTPPKKDSKLRLVGGRIWVNVKKMVTEGTMEVEMSQAIAGSRGTRFILTETGNESKIEVTEGTVAYRSKTDGTEVMVSAGESVTATATGLNEKTTFDPVSLDAELLNITTRDAPTPISADPSIVETSSASEENGSGVLLYGVLLGLLVVIVGGVWVMKRKKSVSTKPYTMCQSCGFPLKKDAKGGGTEKDGSTSTMYCSMCYMNGAFLNPPEIDTPEKMQTFCIQEMKKAGMNGIFAWLATRPIPKLKRWKK